MKYDYLVIGSGPAGHTSAIKAAQCGLKTAIIDLDENMVGGVCLNEGCIPAKSLYNSAKIYDIVRRNQELYSKNAERAKADISLFVEKSRQAAETLRKGINFLFKKNNIDLYIGIARFVDKNTVKVSKKGSESIQLSAKNILIATGSVPNSFPGKSFDGKRLMSSFGAIRCKKIPEKLLVIGGGAIGTEFASFFSIIGSTVTVVETEKRILPLEDKDISREMEKIFKKKNIIIYTAARVNTITTENDTVKISMRTKKGMIEENFDAVLVSIGRKPNVSTIKPENAGIKIDEKGYIPVDKEMRTNVDNIFAAGDIIKTPMLAHVAASEGEIAAEAVAGRQTEPIDYTCVPNVVYTEVQIASAGMTEEDALSQSNNISVGKQFFRANGKAVVDQKTDGFIKVIADKDTRKILGIHIIGYEAGELVHEFVVAKKAGLTVEDIEHTVHAHPTFSEISVDACKSVFGKPIHG
ncbi:MAG: dihydrolipoyl dehydrogenase [Candidatus Omnitrophica bacterium]|nr:dihydrolipoyl dehydrogenase [Candidatus Omnitrophota bacterium]